MGKQKLIVPYNKTPLIIKEILGEEVYNMMEEAMKNYKPRLNYQIITSAEGMKLLEKALKKENLTNTL